MAHSDDLPRYEPGDELYNSELYKALSQGNSNRVVELCRKIPEGPLHVVSIQNDTVLHVASFSMQHELVLKLLQIVPRDQLQNLTHQNEKGNTILHEAATFNKMKTAAERMLEISSQLLDMHNNSGETALYRAVQYGKATMFEFLDGKVKQLYPGVPDSEKVKLFYEKQSDGSNILHAAVSAEQFELALLIAKKYEYLFDQRDNSGRTALQLLASNSLAFQGRRRRYMRRFICRRNYGNTRTITSQSALGWRVPWWEEIKKEVRIYEDALALADSLISKDISWKKTNSVEVVEGNGSSSSTHEQHSETPLFAATKSGCIDIVEKILDKYPQAVEHVDHNGWTILHIAIKYRQMEVFDMVEKMKFPMRRLIQKVDHNSNSILHMVGEKEEKNVLEWRMRSSALQLHENLLLFERVKKICSESFFRHVNLKDKTAEELFVQNNIKLCEEAREWLKGTAQSFSIVGVLIATIAFAVTYTVPGGPDQQTGAPVLLKQPLFLIFIVTDVLSLSCALISIVIFLKILAYPFKLNDFKQSLPQQLMLGVSFLFISISLMIWALIATIMLMAQIKQQWSTIPLYIVGFLPIPVSFFANIYTPLDFPFIRTAKYVLKKTGAFFPRYVCESRNIDTSNSSREVQIRERTALPQEVQIQERTALPQFPV